MSEEWGPWIEHDGNGCPVAGRWVHAVVEGRPGETFNVEGAASDAGCWYWSQWHLIDPYGLKTPKLLRYRVRIPPALTLLREIARNPERETEDA